MATQLEDAIELIRAGLEERAKEQLVENRNASGGPLEASIQVFVQEEDDFVVEFLDYGVFLDQGTQFIQGIPFYSNLAEVELEDVTDILEEAFNQDVEALDNNLNEQI